MTSNNPSPSDGRLLIGAIGPASVAGVATEAFDQAAGSGGPIGVRRGRV